MLAAWVNAELTLSEKIKNIRNLKSKFKSFLHPDGDANTTAIIIPIYNSVLANENILRMWFEKADTDSSPTKMHVYILNFVSHDEVEKPLSEWLQSRSIIRAFKLHSRDNLEYLRALIGTFRTALDTTSSSRFVLCTGKLIPISSPSEFIQAIYKDELSWMDIIRNFPKEREAYASVDQSVLSYQSIRKMDPTGMVLTRYHLQLILRIEKEVGADLTVYWSKCIKPELSYFPTMMGLLGLLNDYDNVTKQQRRDVLIRPVVYCHYVGYPGDDRTTEAVFDVLSEPMMQEFKQSGALFVKNYSISLEEGDKISALESSWLDMIDIPFPTERTILRTAEAVEYRNAARSANDTQCNDRVSSVSKRMKKTAAKIVINSNKNYRKPFTYLMASILESDFCKNLSFTTEDIIVSISQADEDRGPELRDINTLSDFDITSPLHAFAEGKQVVVIESRLNNFDWTAHHSLFVHRSHYLVDSDYYLYLLDTSRVDKIFWRKVLEKLPTVSVSGSDSSTDEDPFRERVMVTTKPHSSISIFGKGVVRNYGTNFEKTISKNDGLTLEMFEKPIFYADGYVLHGLTRFGELQRLSPRSKVGEDDWYGTGKLRHLYYYEDIGVTKSILIGNSGDISGTSQKLALSAKPV